MSTAVPTLARLDLMTIDQVMHAGMVACDPDAPLVAVARILAEKRIHCVVVSGIGHTGRGDRLSWGTVSDRDVMQAIAERRGDATAGRIATTELVTVEPTESVERAAQLMAEHDVAHLVVELRGFPVGVISSLDVAGAAARSGG